MARKNILVFGGDKRNLFLFELLKSQGYSVQLSGFDEHPENKIPDLNLLTTSELVVGPIPLLKDNHPNFPFTKDEPDLIPYFTGLKSAIDLVTIDQIGLSENPSIHVIDITKERLFAELNAIPTAEGIVKILLEEAKKTLRSSKVLITGYGNVAKETVRVLKALGSTITIVTASEAEIQEAENNGNSAFRIKSLTKYITQQDFIINTIPWIFFDEDVLQRIEASTTLIDVASKPGGIDLETASQYGVHWRKESGIPGRFFPETSAQTIAAVLKNLRLI